MTLWKGRLKRVNKEKMRCPVVFSEEITAFRQMKMSQIDTGSFKNPQTFQFAKILSVFPVFRRILKIGTLERISKEGVCCSVCLEEIKSVF